MINDWKLGMRMLRYAYGVKMNCIAGGLLLLLEIIAIVIGRMEWNVFPACYILLVAGMLPVQMLLSLSLAGMIQASPMKKKLQTGIPALMNFSIMAVLYLVMALVSEIMFLGRAEYRDYIYSSLIMLALSLAMIMLYMGVAYKHFILATVGLVPILCFVLTKGMTGEEMLGFLTGKGLSLWKVIPGGIGILALGAVPQYLLSLLVYRAPMDKKAQSARLRSEI